MPRIAVLFAAVLSVFFLAEHVESDERNQTMVAIEPNVAALLESTADDAFLIIGISGTPDFVQMSGYRGTALLDFPLITPRQKELRESIEEVCKGLGLEKTVVTGSDGSEFLDYDLPANAAQIADIVKTILVKVYGAEKSTVLEFEANGFRLPAT